MRIVFCVLVCLFHSVASAQEGIPVDLGTKDYPPGLLNETDERVIQSKRIEALTVALEALSQRYQTGLIGIEPVLQTQLELIEAQLESTPVKQERMLHLEGALRSALILWQRAKQAKDLGMQGGDAASEAKARAAVYRYRRMWLMEKKGAQAQ